MESSTKTLARGRRVAASRLQPLSRSEIGAFVNAIDTYRDRYLILRLMAYLALRLDGLYKKEVYSIPVGGIYLDNCLIDMGDVAWPLVHSPAVLRAWLSVRRYKKGVTAILTSPYGAVAQDRAVLLNIKKSGLFNPFDRLFGHPASGRVFAQTFVLFRGWEIRGIGGSESDVCHAVRRPLHRAKYVTEYLDRWEAKLYE